MYIKIATPTKSKADQALFIGKNFKYTIHQYLIASQENITQVQVLTGVDFYLP